eukprot:9651879-Alexandrium_andersonii.AAC.1
MWHWLRQRVNGAQRQFTSNFLGCFVRASSAFKAVVCHQVTPTVGAMISYSPRVSIGRWPLPEIRGRARRPSSLGRR